jgi:hypothetical protein
LHEKKYLHFLAAAVDDLNALEKQLLWQRLEQKAKENFELSFPVETPAVEVPVEPEKK